MRHINNRHLPRYIDTTRADNAKAQCDLLPEGERSQFIDDSANCWSYLRPALWQLGGLKCWYSEAQLQEQEGQVEHFRPKKRLHGATHPGYWWRAFDWTNMRLSHPSCNFRRKDYLSGETTGKGSYFPLRDENARATSSVEESAEQPILLDPTIPSDCMLLSFDSSNGRPIPSYSEEADAWKHQRAVNSISLYHLDEGTWNYRRKDLMDEVRILCEKILDAEEGSIESDSLMNELLVYFDHHSEFTSASKQVAKEKGLLQ
ncbi:MAG: hypothetical protein ABJQ78_06290 [Alloalcanivorax sp.]